MANQLAAAQKTPLVRMNPRGLGDITRDCFFQYAPPTPFTFAVGNENFQTAIQIQTDADFLCTSTSYTNSVEVGNIVANTSVSKLEILNGGAVIQLSDGSSQRFLSSVQVPLNSLFGDGRLPHIWEYTHLFRAGGSISINITGMAAAAPFAGQVIRLVFSGFKVPVGVIPFGS